MPHMTGMAPVAFTVHNALTKWNLGPFALFMAAVLVFVAGLYLRADWRLAIRGRAWSSWRTTSFLAGLLTVELAFGSPVATFTGSYFQAHVIQHLLLMIIAPPLLALGAPSTLLLQTASRKTKTRWLAVLRSRPFAVLSHPISTWTLFYGVMFIFFLTSLINVAMEHMALMDFLNIVFLLGGALFWWPTIGLDPILHWKADYGLRLINVLVGAGLEAFLGVALLESAKPVASMYSLASTHAGGGLLWSGTDLGLLIAAVPISIQWARSEARAGLRHNTRLDGESRLSTSEPAISPAKAPSAWELAWLSRTGFLPDQSSAGPGGPQAPARQPDG